MKELKFRTLTADEIDCRVGTISDKGFSLLLYKDARCDQNVLDETVGAFNWQRDHKEVKGNMFCGVSIWDEERKQWVTKWDCGVESNTEKEKGEASDSFKRACFNWGIGRELYTAPFIWVKGNVEKNAKGNLVPTFKSIKVVKLEYLDGHIHALTISGDGTTIYTYGHDEKPQPQDKPAQTSKQSVKSDKMTLEEAITLKTSQNEIYGDLPNERLEWIATHPERVGETRQRAAQIILDDRASVTEDALPEIEEGLPF